MFLENKYTKWYYLIIENRKHNPIINEYTECHHIIPKSLGGSNKKDNLVNLSAREHFICHCLLINMTQNEYHKQKMIYAAYGMMIMNNEKINSKIYESLKKQHSSLMRLNNPMFDPIVREKVSNKIKGLPSRSGFKLSKEHRRKLSEAKKGSIPWNKGKKYEGGGMTGKNHSEETKLKISKSKQGQQISNESRQKISEQLTGISRSVETKKKISDAKKGIIHPKKTCEYCGKKTAVGMYARWHGKNCKNYSE